MENEDVILEVDNQVSMLQEKLKGRLKETQDLSDLSKDVFKSSLELEENTEQLKETSVKTKWKWFMEYLKWVVIAIVVISVLFLILLKLIRG